VTSSWQADVQGEKANAQTTRRTLSAAQTRIKAPSQRLSALDRDHSRGESEGISSRFLRSWWKFKKAKTRIEARKIGNESVAFWKLLADSFSDLQET
jgi:hypothetical protein